MASKCRSTKKPNPIAIATDRTAVPYRRIVGMGVGDEGSRCAMACLIREPADQRGDKKLSISAKPTQLGDLRTGGRATALPVLADSVAKVILQKVSKQF